MMADDEREYHGRERSSLKNVSFDSMADKIGHWFEPYGFGRSSAWSRRSQHQV